MKQVVRVFVAVACCLSASASFAQQGVTYSLWSSSAVPATASFAAGSPNELGVKFTSDVSGYVTGIRFYKGSGNTGTHIGHLWTSTGTLLASATFTNETASGWQQVSFAQPVLISANTVYVASYWDPNGNYALNRPYFTTEYNNAPLHALADSTAAPNGVYLSGSSGFPTATYDDSNYWVDVVFVPATQVSLWSASAVPATASFADNNAYEIGVKFTSDVGGYVTGIRFYKGSGNTGTHVGHLWTSGGSLLASATFTNETASGWQQVSFAQPVLISANTDYVASYWDPKGNYALTRPYFTSEYNNAPLHALANGTAGSNGAYLWNSSAFPSSGYDASNYWVDVAFSPLPAATTTTSASSATISSISPTSGPVSGGTLVTINGAGFESGATVSFGGANASSVTVISSTELTAVTPAGSAGAVNVTVTDPSSGDGSLADGFMYISGPTVSGVSPSSGPTTGGTTVTISGTGFESGVSVTFGATLAASVTVLSSTQIQAVAPAGSAGSVSVTITNPDAGTASLSSGFDFVATTQLVASSGALLTGMTPSNYTLPAGWTLMTTDNFESGSLPAGQGFYNGSNTESINCSFAHLGKCSLDTYVTHSYGGVGLVINGTYINSRETDVSWWQYTQQNNPGYGVMYTDWYMLERDLPGVDSVFPNWQSPGGSGCNFACNPASISFFQNNANQSTGPAPWAIYGGIWNEDLNQWVQYEVHLKVNDPGTDNGRMDIYQNGQLMLSVYSGAPNINTSRCPVFNDQNDCGYFVGSQDFTNAQLFIGGDWGAVTPSGDNQNMASCTPASACPPNGNIPYFHIYIDDVVVLKK